MKSFSFFAVFFFTTVSCGPASAPVPPPAAAASAAAPKLDAAALNSALAQLERDVATARLHDDAARWGALLATADTLAQQTTDPRARRVRAAALLALGRATEARVTADALAAADANDVVAFGLTADAALAMGDLAACEAALERMMALAPGLPVYARAAELRFRTGDVDGSLELWREAFQAGHKSEPEALAYAAAAAGDVFLYGKGDVVQAGRSYDAALAAVAGYPAAVTGKARVAVASGVACAAVDGADADAVAASFACAGADGANDDAAFVAAVERAAARDERGAALALALRGTALDAAAAHARAAAAHAGGLDDADAGAFVAWRRGDLATAIPLARRALSWGTADVRVQARAALVLADAALVDGNANANANANAARDDVDANANAARDDVDANANAGRDVVPGAAARDDVGANANANAGRDVVPGAAARDDVVPGAAARDDVVRDARALLLKIKDAPGLEPRLRALVRATLSR